MKDVPRQVRIIQRLPVEGCMYIRVGDVFDVVTPPVGYVIDSRNLDGIWIKPGQKKVLLWPHEFEIFYGEL